MKHDEKIVEKWGGIRIKGKLKYIIINNILPAIAINLIIVGAISFINYGPLFLYKETVILRFLILSMVMAIIGYFIGLHYWKKYEEIYEYSKRI
jgi:hypothetical protein